MRIKWLPASMRDLQRLYDFLVDVNPSAAARRVDQILDATEKLLEQPRLGHVLEDLCPQDVRAWIVSDYEIRYEIDGDTIIILAYGTRAKTVDPGQWLEGKASVPSQLR